MLLGAIAPCAPLATSSETAIATRRRVAGRKPMFTARCRGAAHIHERHVVIADRYVAGVCTTNLARPEGFEPPTPAFGGQYSIQLSYGRAWVGDFRTKHGVR